MGKINASDNKPSESVQSGGLVDSQVDEQLLMGSATTKGTGSPGGALDKTVVYEVYCSRWLVLSVCCFLALSNAMQWISFSSLPDEVQMYYRGTPANGSIDVALITNQIFQFVAFLTGFGGMYITDNMGIKIAGLLGTTLNFVGATLRMIASVPNIESHLTREILLHTGSFIAASAQAFFLVLPSKIAECWFPAEQRAIANVLSFIANPAGVALGTIVPSILFKEYTNLHSRHWIFFFFLANPSSTSLYCTVSHAANVRWSAFAIGSREDLRSSYLLFIFY